jgi:hypothetical protein
MMDGNGRINIFPFTVSYFEKTSAFEYYIRQILPDILTIEHTMLRKPHTIIFAYQGDHSLWGYAEIENWYRSFIKQVRTMQKPTPFVV